MKKSFYVRTQAKRKKISDSATTVMQVSKYFDPPLRRIRKVAAVVFAARRPGTAFCELTQRRSTVEKVQILYLDPNTKVERIHLNHSPLIEAISDTWLI